MPSSTNGGAASSTSPRLPRHGHSWGTTECPNSRGHGRTITHSRSAGAVRAAQAPRYGAPGPASDGQTRQSPEGHARDLEQSQLHFTGWATRPSKIKTDKSSPAKRPLQTLSRNGNREDFRSLSIPPSAMPFISSCPCQNLPTRLSVQRAARAFATREFSNHQYAMVLHTFETDPDPHPARHPHVHLTVKTAGLDGTRLNPRKPDLQCWREGFAEALREQGIEATTTSRLHRTTHERWTVRHLVDEATQARQRGPSHTRDACPARPTRGDAEL